MVTTKDLGLVRGKDGLGYVNLSSKYAVNYISDSTITYPDNTIEDIYVWPNSDYPLGLAIIKISITSLYLTVDQGSYPYYSPGKGYIHDIYAIDITNPDYSNDTDYGLPVKTVYYRSNYSININRTNYSIDLNPVVRFQRTLIPGSPEYGHLNLQLDPVLVAVSGDTTIDQPSISEMLLDIDEFSIHGTSLYKLLE